MKEVKSGVKIERGRLKRLWRERRDIEFLLGGELSLEGREELYGKLRDIVKEITNIGQELYRYKREKNRERRKKLGVSR